MNTLLDTNVLSELLRAQPEPAVLAWWARQRADSLYTSVVTQAEMLLGARLLAPGRRRQRLEQGLEAMFNQDFAARVLPFDAEAASAWAVIVAERRAAGRPISQFDAQIAAIAASRRLALATRNQADFESCSLTLINPWEGSG